MKVKAFYPAPGEAFVVGEAAFLPPAGVLEYIDGGERENLVTEIDIAQDLDLGDMVCIRYTSGQVVQRLLAPGDGWLLEPSSEAPRLEPDDHS